MSEQATKPAIDPSPANPLWVFVCANIDSIEARIRNTKNANLKAAYEQELKYWHAIEALVDRWLKGKGE